MTKQLRPLECHQFAYGNDNYGVLLHASDTGEAACIDAGDAPATQQALKETGWTLTHVFITHHHADHTAGLASLKGETNCHVVGPAATAGRIGHIDQALSGGDRFEFAGRQVDVLHTPGHTMDMLNYYLPEEAVVFTGDTLFVLGCGRLFEGDAAMMWESLSLLAELPANTRVYCGHEYTQANAEFAVTVDPANLALASRVEAITSLRAEGRPTVPTTIGAELAENPFLRAADPGIRAHLDMTNASDAEVFAEIRRRKDNF